MTTYTEYDLAVQTCRASLQNALAISAKDQLLIVADVPARRVGEAFHEAALGLPGESLLVIMPPLSETSMEPPQRIARWLRESTAFVIATDRGGMTHTVARREATEAGARGVTMPGATLQLLASGGIATDYRKIAEATTALAASLNGTSEILIQSPNGTELRMDVHGGTWFAERGLCDRPGDFGNLPGGEVSIAPVDAEGVLVIDGSINPLGALSTPIRMTIAGRRIVDIEGDRAGDLRDFLSSFGPGAFNVAEIGIGMNPGARFCGITLEDEKVLGTLHIGFGNNSNMGGVSLADKVAVGVHIDGVLIDQPELHADGRPVDPRRFFTSR